jgi:thioredoxin
MSRVQQVTTQDFAREVLFSPVPMSRVQQVTTEDFAREVLNSPVPVVVDVYADWCGPCRAIAPLLERATELYAGRLKFLKVDIDQDPDVAERCQVTGVPTLLFFRDGRLTDRVVGLSDPRALAAKFGHLADHPLANS